MGCVVRSSSGQIGHHRANDAFSPRDATLVCPQICGSGRDEGAHQKQSDLALNPGRAWRTGAAKKVFGDRTGYFDLYPANTLGKQPEKPKKSNRCNKDLDTIKPDEAYRAPSDPHMDLLRAAIEEPSVLAGFSSTSNLPVLEGGKMEQGTSYAWVPLARRLDNDRLYRAMRESGFFQDVWPWGTYFGDGKPTIYKIEPWAHMNCYKLHCKIAAAPKAVFEVGSTDNKNSRHSSSGARLYVQGPPAHALNILQMIGRVLPEHDFDAEGGFDVILPSGEEPWGVPRGGENLERLRRTSGIPANWKDMSLDDQGAVVRQALSRADAEEIPQNSRRRVFLATLVREVAQEMAAKAEQAWRQTVWRPAQLVSSKRVEDDIDRQVKRLCGDERPCSKSKPPSPPPTGPAGVSSVSAETPRSEETRPHATVSADIPAPISEKKLDSNIRTETAPQPKSGGLEPQTTGPEDHGASSVSAEAPADPRTEEIEPHDNLAPSDDLSKAVDILQSVGEAPSMNDLPPPAP